jgi:CPA2 family monovalent cation:H+ antiporter-2
MIINSVLSALAFRLLDYSWSNSFYAGALMAQIGEYSLLISAIAFQTGLISNSYYKNILSACGFSILFSTIWITLMRAFIFKKKSFLRQGLNEFLEYVKN